MNIRRFFDTIIQTPFRVTALLGVVIVLSLPPFVSKHQAVLSLDSIPLNRLMAFYPTVGSDSLKLVSFLRDTETAMFLERDRSDYRLPGYDYQQYMDRYCPVPAPIRPCVYLGHLKGEKSTEVLHLSQYDEGTFLHVSDASTFVTDCKVMVPLGGKLNLTFVQFFESPQVGVVYFLTFSTQANKHLVSSLYRFDYQSNKIDCVCSLDGLARAYTFTDYPEYILLGLSSKSDDFLHVYNIQTEKIERIIQNSVDSPFYSRYAKNIQMHPYVYTSDLLFVSRSNGPLGTLNVDSLLLKGKVEFTALRFSEKTKKRLRVKYSRDGVVFYGGALSPENYKLYKYDKVSNKSRVLRHGKDIKVGQVLFYGDMDSNGKKELVYSDITLGEEAICVWEEGSSYDLVRCPISRQRFPIQNCVFYNNKELRFQCKGVTGTLNYAQNDEYYKSWLWRLFIYSGFLLLGFLLKKLKENKEYRIHYQENKVLSLQLENIQKRIDPHFIFNSLNNLGSLILDGDNNVSYDYLSKVSGVLYKALHDRNLLIDIESELSFCTSLLDIQSERFKDKFEYEVSIDKSVDLSQMIPPNVLNCFVDNCIKHGFNGIDYTGVISIEFLSKPDGVLIAVQDNGIGRELAKTRIKVSTSTGTGLDICDKYVKLFNHKRKENFLRFSILDVINDDGAVVGTRCEFYVPAHLKFIYE